jgi:hypothetical protein
MAAPRAACLSSSPLSALEVEAAGAPAALDAAADAASIAIAAATSDTELAALLETGRVAAGRMQHGAGGTEADALRGATGGTSGTAVVDVPLAAKSVASPDRSSPGPHPTASGGSLDPAAKTA